MIIYDVSMTISEDMQVYKNKPEKKPKIEVVSDFDHHESHETQITMNLHTGTHMDFPLHMIKDGDDSNHLNLSKLIRKVKVFDFSHVVDSIKVTDLELKSIEKNDFILFKTKNSAEDAFNPSFIYLDEESSTYLAEKQISGVGIDALGIERDQKGHPTHKNLMQHDILIIEGLRLRSVKENEYTMVALPLKIKGSDALPLSVILIEKDSV